MDIVKVRELTDTELGQELATQRRSLYDLRFQLATRQLTDHSQLSQVRRAIARILTVITERGLDENELARQTAPAPAARGRGRSAARKSSGTTKKTATDKATAESGTGGKE